MIEKNLKKTVGENIKMLRLFRGLSGVDLAEKLSIDSQHLSKWEAGDSIPSVEYIEKLSKILKKHRSFFFAG